MIPISQIVQCVASSSFRLAQGVPALEVAARLRETLAPCYQDEAYRERLAPLATVLPAAGDLQVVPEIESNTLAWALYATIQNLSDVPEGATGFTDLLGTARDRFESTILKDSNPPPALSGVFAVSRSRELSNQLVERQMVDTLKLTVLGALHDANNALAVLTSNLHETQRDTASLIKFIDRNIHHLPGDVAPLVPAYSWAIDKNVQDIGQLVGQTIQLIRKIQALLNLSNKAKTDLKTIPELFEEGGFMHRIGAVLDEIHKDLQQSDTELAAIFKLSDTHGHYLPEDVLAEGMRLLNDLRDYFSVFREMEELIRELFGLLKEVVDGIQNEPGALSLGAGMALINPRMIGAVMGKGVKVTLDLQAGVWPIWGKTIHIAQILLNLACNARDAMERFGEFSVSTRNVGIGAAEMEMFEAMDSALIRPFPRPGDYVVLTLQDSGPGIPAEMLPHIFTLAVSGKGSSGIGLAVILKLVRDMGGFIVVNSHRYDRPGLPRGTAFSLYFPRHL